LKHKHNEDQEILDLMCKYWQRGLYPPLDLADDKLKAFYEGLPTTPNWIETLVNGTGLTYTALAEKLNTSRQAVKMIAEREKTGRVAIHSLNEIAQAMDCKVVYAIVPKNHKSYKELILDKCIPLVNDRDIQKLKAIAAKKYATALFMRTTSLLSISTGWLQAWEYKKAKLRTSHYWYNAKRRLSLY